MTFLALGMLDPRMGAGTAHAADTAEAVTPAIDAAGDGPYLLPARHGWTAKRVGANLRPILETVEPLGRIRVAPVGDIPAFAVPLRPRVEALARDTLPLDPDTKLLVLGDTHGEYEILVAFLKANGVVDDKLKWSFGKGQIVVTGDMFDRGAHQTEILWLFYKLEGEARKAGGALHVLLGNHERMVLTGDARYLHPRYPQASQILGQSDYAALFASDTLLGDWLRSRPAVLKLGDMLFLHGGISPAIVDANISVTDMNKAIRMALDTHAKDQNMLAAPIALVAGNLGPQWYRGYFGTGDKKMSDADVERSLALYGVNRILVGHTKVERVMPLYGGKVIGVQVYPHRDASTGAPVLEAALREEDRWYRVSADGTRHTLAVDGK